ncbi:MAG: hypothetical protein JWQ66_2107 [Mucilaginibacter sp.]|nr:hypothetical protein [Mucilaginibacter sp.]
MKKLMVIALLFLGSSSASWAQQGHAKISGKLDFLQNTDSVTVSLYKYSIFDQNPEMQVRFSKHAINHSYSVEFPVGTLPRYFSLAVSQKRLERNLFYLIGEAGDDVDVRDTIVGGNYTFIFTGRGAEKYRLLFQLRHIDNQWTPRIKGNDPNFIRRDFEYRDSAALEKLHYLEICRNLISAPVYKLIKAEILGADMEKGYAVARRYKGDAATPFITTLSAYKEDAIILRNRDSLLADPGFLIHTLYIPEALIDRYRLDSCFLKGKNFDVAGCYQYLRNHYSGVLRDYLITLLIYNRKNTTVDLSPFIRDALTMVNESDLRAVLEKLSVNNLAGQPGYNFSLPDEHGLTRTLQEFKGKVVLIDFWYTGCPSCALTAPILAKMEPAFSGKPVVFLSVSIDTHKDVWLQSVKDGVYTSEYNLNLYTNGDGKHHAIIDHYGISAFPTLILIGKDGKLLETVGDPRTDHGKRLTQLIERAIMN